MDQFYLENVQLYQSLVKAFKKPEPKQATMTNTSDMIVSARIRPMLNDEEVAGFPCALYQRATDGSVVDIHDLYNHPRGRPILKSFNYEVDRLFNWESTTEEIYESLVADLVPFAGNGGIGTLFTYGQTGSGKTFTISQIEQLVASSLMEETLLDSKRVYLTIVDLAGNSAYDLLDSRKPVSVLEDSFGVTQLSGATERWIQSRDEMVDLIERASTFRRTAPTFKNDASSRSHGICRIRIHNPSTASEGYLYLIDLAGSEAARDVAIHGPERMRETREINMSLSVLKDCIRGKVEADLAQHSRGTKAKQRKPHIPFRQSTLTKVLKHVFDPAEIRACKTIVIACLNPSLADVSASKNTLRYAEMLRVMVPKVNEKHLNEQNTRTESVKFISSRDLGLSDASVPFTDRLRPGMIVSWQDSIGTEQEPDGSTAMNLAAIICPMEAILVDQQGDSRPGHRFSRNDPRTELESDQQNGTRYLCARFISLPGPGLYDLRLWDQLIIETSLMKEEMDLEYDLDKRVYRIVD